MMHICYNYIFCVGRNYHRVDLYEDYSDEIGLQQHSQTFRDTTAVKLQREVRAFLTPEQDRLLKLAMRDKSDIIVSPDGTIGR